jgi:uncharacterized membrane-anchored protein
MSTSDSSQSKALEPKSLDSKPLEPYLLDSEPQEQPNPAAEAAAPLLAGRRLPSWRFWLPMLLQLGLILPVPLRNAYVSVSGKTIILETIAVDPYDLFRGYSQVLAYKISDSDSFEKLPGYQIVEQLENQPGDNRQQLKSEAFYVLIEAPKGKVNATVSPLVWKPVGIVRDRPTTLPANQIALRATSNGNAILYNLERYYMPEDRRNEINQMVQELQSREVGDVKVEAKVDRFGKAIPVSLWLGDRRYQF